MQTSVLAALAELDIGTVILRNCNSLAAAAVAEQCACDKRGTEVLLDALSALGYLIKSGNRDSARYAVADEYTTYLDSRHPSTFIPLMRHMSFGISGGHINNDHILMVINQYLRILGREILVCSRLFHFRSNNRCRR
ncbi:MAG: methyltransferase family protein [Desulfobulbus sp.]